MAEQIERLAPPSPDHEVIFSVARPFKDTGGLRLLSGNLAPDGGAILKLAGVEGRGLRTTCSSVALASLTVNTH